MREKERHSELPGPERECHPVPLVFADIFAGCGGLSLGLSEAGWTGLFAIEKNTDAFATLRSNLIDSPQNRFEWPGWLAKAPVTTSQLLRDHGEQLDALQGKVTLLAGGPPCQGFSLAGRRTHGDPRNGLTAEYIRIVKKLKPRFLVIENVQGFTLPFLKHGDEQAKRVPYSARVAARLRRAGYVVHSGLVDLSRFGVPQARKRFILIGIRKGDPALLRLQGENPLELLDRWRGKFLSWKRLPTTRAVTAKEAIHDLRVSGATLRDCEDSPVKGFQQIEYSSSRVSSSFARLMRRGVTGAPDSLRLARHSETVVQRFKLIQKTCTPGQNLKEDDRLRLGVKKHALTPLSSRAPSSTVTTLPDDLIHYSEPRILTVRENARLQSFPDWFKFTGQYTTGGIHRRQSCPRYTQVGNAVPPLFAEAIGRFLKQLA